MTTIKNRISVALIIPVLGFGAILTGCGGDGGSAASTNPNSKGSINTLQKIKKAGTIRVGMAVDPPFVLRKADGQFYSFNAELVKQLGKSLNVKVKFVPTGWATVVAGLQGDKYDIIGTSISATPERRKAIDFSVPYAYGGNSWIVLKSSPYKSLKDLNSGDVTIAFASGSFQAQSTKSNMPKAKYRAIQNLSYSSLVSELNAGHSQAISVPSYLVVALMKKFPTLRGIPPNNKGVDTTGVAWGINKNEPALKKSLNEFIKAKKEDGTIDRLYEKWITVENATK